MSGDLSRSCHCVTTCRVCGPEPSSATRTSSGSTDWRATLRKVKSSAAGQLYVVMMSVMRRFASTRSASVRPARGTPFLHQYLKLLQLGWTEHGGQFRERVLPHLLVLGFHLLERRFLAR